MLLSHVKISVFEGESTPSISFHPLKQPFSYWPTMVVKQGLDSKQFLCIHTTQTKQRLKNDLFRLDKLELKIKSSIMAQNKDASQKQHATSYSF